MAAGKAHPNSAFEFELELGLVGGIEPGSDKLVMVFKRWGGGCFHAAERRRTYKDLILIKETGRTRAKEEACYYTKLLVTGIRLKMNASLLGTAIEAMKPTTHQHKIVCTNTPWTGVAA